MKKSIKLFLVLSGLLLSTPVLAADPFSIKGKVTVPSGCEVTDTAGSLHVFPKETSPAGYLGICAIVAAKDTGVVESFSFIDFGFGLFLDSINGVRTSADWDLSWSLDQNGELASVGLAGLVVADGDEISLIYTSFSSGQEFDKLVLDISIPKSGSSGGGGRNIPRPVYSPDIEKAIQFIYESQNPAGLIENPMFTDWAAIAFGAYNPEDTRAQNLRNYLLENPDVGQSLGSPVLSFIRRAMALMALGINPYSGVNTNYIQKIVDAFDGAQIGDPDLVNDDIFALLVLSKAGFEPSGEIVKKTAQFIVSKQKQDGSWTGGVDMTSAGVQSLSLVSGIEEVSQALSKAKVYLQNMQLSEGGFGNTDSTSWAMQAIVALGEDWRKWKKNGNTPGDYLFYLQKTNGSIGGSPLPVLSTSYAVPAALSKPWGAVLQTFAREGEPKTVVLPETDGFEVGAESLQGQELLKIAQQVKQIENDVEKVELRLSILVARTQLENLAKAAEILQKYIGILGVLVLDSESSTGFQPNMLP